MAFDAHVIRVMIASPSDTATERMALAEVVAQWNSDHAEEAKVILLPLTWERDVISEIGSAPQDSINRQLVRRGDALIGVFWTRIGTAAQGNTSGTVEEIEQFVREGKPAVLYFSNRPAEVGTVDPDQLKSLNSFKASMRNRALYFEYDELHELRTRAFTEAELPGSVSV